MGLRRVLLVLSLVSFAASVPPAVAYPAGGLDSFDSSAMVFVNPLPVCEVTPLTQTAVLNGPTTVRRGDPIRLADGRMQIPTEIIQLDLRGSSPAGPVVIREDPARVSRGAVTQQDPGQDFPADSFFDVFTEVDFNGATFVNIDPVHMQSKIYSLPPHAFPYLPPPGTCILLALKGTTVPVAALIHAEHKPLTILECYPAMGTMTVFDAETQTFLNGKSDFPKLVELVHGTLPNGQDHIDTELIAMELVGTAFDQRGGVHPFSAKEPPRTGSFGQTAPGIGSFFDIFTELSIDGSSSSQGPIRVQGNLDVNGGSLFGSHPPDPGRRLTIVGVQLSMQHAVECPADAYPPR